MFWECLVSCLGLKKPIPCLYLNNLKLCLYNSKKSLFLVSLCGAFLPQYSNHHSNTNTSRAFVNSNSYNVLVMISFYLRRVLHKKLVFNRYLTAWEDCSHQNNYPFSKQHGLNHAIIWLDINFVSFTIFLYYRVGRLYGDI